MNALMIRVIKYAVYLAILSVCAFAVVKYFNPERGGQAKSPHQKDEVEGITISKGRLLYFAACAAVIIGVCSTCSPLYPFHIWDDSHIFFTIGKSFWYGKVMYRDLYDQKGPLLYFMHSAAYLISHRTFLGIYFMEVAAAFFFIAYTYKILVVFMDDKRIAIHAGGIIAPLIAAFAYSATNFVFGDSAEEFCLPMMMYSLYVSLHRIKSGTDFPRSELLITGILSGCVLWIKFSLLGFYIGWAIVPIAEYVRQHKAKKILEAVLFIIIGVAIATVPWVFYFGANHAIADWMRVYLYDNIFLYPAESTGVLSVFAAVFRSFVWMGWRNPYMFILTTLSAIVLCKIGNKKVIAHIICIYAAIMLFIFGPGRRYEYYSFDMWMFACFALLPLCFAACAAAFGRPHNVPKKVQRAMLVIPPLAAFCLTPNKGVMRMKKDDFPQYKFAKIISQYKNPTLLNYGALDCGLFTVCDIVPSNKYFIHMHMPLEEMAQEQERIIQSGEALFVVSRKPLQSGKYELIEKGAVDIRHRHYAYYLYRLIDRP